MYALRVRWLAGKFHATPYGAHTNGGRAEWPPSHWRLIRAMINSWKTRRIPDGEIPIGRLAAERPAYWLPRAESCHGRRYVQTDNGRRQLLDSFMAMDEPVVVMWRETDLGDCRDTMRDVLAGIQYLGRAESVAELSECEAVRPNCVPYDGRLSGRLMDILTVAPGTKLEGGIESVSARPADLTRAGYAMPPGATLSQYSYSEPPAAGRVHADLRPSVFRFALEGSLPSRECVASIGRLTKSAVLRRFKSGPSATLSGHGKDGKPLNGHAHASYIATSERPGLVTHLTIFAPGGLNAAEADAVRGLGSVLFRGSRLRVAYLGEGSAADFPELGMFREASVWTSASPFMPARHAKRNGADSAGSQAEREFSLRYGCAVRAEKVGVPRMSPQTDLLHGTPAGSPALLRLTADRPVRGPIMLGFGSHFGLGLFAPEI